MKSQAKDLIIKSKVGKLTKFNPETTKKNTAKLDAVINYAQTIKDWPLLEQAVDAKIEEQEQFIQWWEQCVQKPGGNRR